MDRGWELVAPLSLGARRKFTNVFPSPPKGARENFMTIFYANRKPNWVKWWKTLIKSCLLVSCQNDVMKIPLVFTSHRRNISAVVPYDFKLPAECPAPPASNMFLPPPKSISSYDDGSEKFPFRILDAATYSWCCWCVVTMNRVERRQFFTTWEALDSFYDLRMEAAATQFVHFVN